MTSTSMLAALIEDFGDRMSFEFGRAI